MAVELLHSFWSRPAYLACAFAHHRRFSDADRPVEYFGEQLLAAGYNYHGNEPMYSGVTGEEFAADIYIGVVYYQRLRHMVNDKFQVRTTGPVDPLTRQPVKVGLTVSERHFMMTTSLTKNRAESAPEVSVSERWSVMP
jgi:hypothetical protein